MPNHLDTEGHRRLWQSVLIETLAELAGIQPFNHNKYAQTQKLIAERYLFTNNRDFHMVCALAGMEPEEIRKAAKYVMENPGFKFWNRVKLPTELSTRKKR